MKIAHLADIHVQDRRRDEYAGVFARLYESLRAEAPDLIVVAGDVFDNKMRASAHNMEDVLYLLTSLTDIAPVVMIPGNHDLNVFTPGALDLLTPLVAEHRTLQPPRLTYWRNSGVYIAHGIVWTVIATDGARPSAEEEGAALGAAPAGAPHVCLFHEEVNGRLLLNGARLRDFKLSASSFAEYDLALGGHIHLRQRFAPRAAYCGSLVQQNIGEPHRGHGYILWELIQDGAAVPHRTALPSMRGIDIRNPAGYLRVEIDAAGRDVTARPIPETPLYWEVVHDEAAPAELVEALVAEYTSLFEEVPPRVVRQRRRDGAAVAAPQDGGAEAVVDAQAAAKALDRHEEIIREILTASAEPASVVDSVVALHRERFAGAPAGESGGRFRILRLEFDNVYAFGPGNVVDFAALEGCVSGVVAPNHTGKSSLIEALLFALYEDHPRAPVKKDVIHRGANTCRLVLEFELEGRRGRIEKSFHNARRQTVTQSYRFEFAGEDRTQGGTKETLAEIASVVGGPAGALASSFQLQNNEVGSFVALSPVDRKKLLANALSLGSFEALERAAARELTEAGGEVRALSSQFRGRTLAAIAEALAAVAARRDERRQRIGNLAGAAEALGRDLLLASQELGEAAAGRTAAAAEAARLAAAVPPRTDPEQAERAESAFRRWDELLGGVSAGEDRAAPDTDELVAPGPGEQVPTPVQLERQVRELAAAAVASAAAEAAARQAELELAAARALNESARRQARALDEAEPEATPPGEPVGVTGELKGAKPDEASVLAAVATLSVAAPVEDFSGEIDAAKRARAAAVVRLSKLPAVGAPAATAYRRGEATPALITKLAGILAEAQSWSAAVSHLATIRARLRPQTGCPGCDHACTLLDESSAAEAEKDAVEASAEYAAAVLAARREIREEIHVAEAALAAAAGRRAQVHEQNLARAVCEKTLQIANYWHARRREAAQGHAEARRSAEAAAEKQRRFKAAQAEASRAAGAEGALRAALDDAVGRRQRAVALRRGWLRVAEAADDIRAAAAAAAVAEEAAARHDRLAKLFEVTRTAAEKAREDHRAAASALAADEWELGKLTQEAAVEESRAAAAATAEARHRTLKAYRAVLRPNGGIADRLLEQSRAALERRINDGLRELGARFEAQITPEYEVEQRMVGDDWLPASLGSGYQKFVLSLAARLAIWRLAAAPRPDAFFIDEGFGACDEDYLELMTGALEALAGAPDGPRLIFIVSHVEALKMRVERPLQIEVTPAGSRVFLMAPAMAAAPPATDQSVIVPDGSRVHCRACGQTLAASFAERHAKSAKHIKNLQKRQENNN
ncbi:MAG: metallophosphoesterase [Gemmatimonadaceae bacterium]|jgi:DNA repair exonuclease SbcCD ATPase subunit/DNA repair exonuclease SbcCD nuclease subunit